MKKRVICLALTAVMLCGCASVNISIIGGADGPTNIKIGKEKDDQEYDRDDIKMVRLDGALYYETGEDNDSPRCGVTDGCLKKTAGKYEIPQNDGESNFGGDLNYQVGMRENTIEIRDDDDWEIFEKISTDMDVLQYKYCYVLEGRLPNAKTDSEFLVLSNDKNTTFSEAAYIIFGADVSQQKDIYVIPIVD